MITVEVNVVELARTIIVLETLMDGTHVLVVLGLNVEEIYFLGVLAFLV